MASNRFFDETKIIKKNLSITQPEEMPEPLPIPMPEQIQEPIIEKPKVKRKKRVEQQPIEVDTADQYKAAVQKIIEEEPDVAAAQPKKPSININIETAKPNKPIYKYSKKDGKVNIETKAFKESQNQIVNQSNDDARYEMIEKMLDETEQELLRLSIELDVHAQVTILIESSRKQIYENKTKHIQDEIKYNEKRKLVLEKMLNSR